MNKTIKKILIWLGLTILMMILWPLGMKTGDMLFPSGIMDLATDANNNTGLLFFIVCALNTWVILYFISHTQYNGWKLAGLIFFTSFGIQYFMSQIETFWFNDSLKLPINGIWAIISGGAFMTLLFSIMAVWATGNFSHSKQNRNELLKFDLLPLVKRITILSLVVWPSIYFLAGYFIAWQFAEVRLLYSGTEEMDTFASMMAGNFSSGLYFFQILRGLLWILIALPVLFYTAGSTLQKGVLIGLLFAILGSSGLLIPNPVMPFMVRMGHLIETSSSDFIWGLLIAWYLGKVIPNSACIKLPEPETNQLAQAI